MSTSPGSQCNTIRGITLIEVLAVISILSVAAAVTMTSLAGASDDAHWRSAVADVHDIDFRGRLHGRAGRPSVMTALDDGHRLCLHGVANADVFAECSLPAGLTVQLIRGQANRAVRFDRLGRSDDYSVEARSASRVETWHVCGLTGFVLQEPSP